MASTIRMRHPQTGIVKKGFYGFSWTSFFFNGIPAMIRGDFVYGIGIFLVCLLVSFFTLGIGALVIGIIWAFIYNKNYTQRLVQAGYEFDDDPTRVSEARSALGIA